MREYIIAHVQAAPDWQRAPVLELDQPLWGTDAGIRAWGQLCWDESALHLRLRAREPHIRAEHPAGDRLAMPCEDSCLEFFFSPAAGDARYFNIEYNPNACLYLGFGGERAKRLRLIPRRDPFEPETARGDGGWSLTCRIPFDFIRQFYPDFAPRPGDELRANAYKCGDLTIRPHYLAWNPVFSPTPDFHRPQDFGRMVFGE